LACIGRHVSALLLLLLLLLLLCGCCQVLSWIDVCAGLSAKTLARGPCVTISVDAVHFFRWAAVISSDDAFLWLQLSTADPVWVAVFDMTVDA
jgi:hypothetical protein